MWGKCINYAMKKLATLMITACKTVADTTEVGIGVMVLLV